MDSGKKVFLFDEVAKHNEHKNCWLVINGKVSSCDVFCNCLFSDLADVVLNYRKLSFFLSGSCRLFLQFAYF